jgi:hypothetical protein
MNLEKFNHFSYIFLLKNVVIFYIVVFFGVRFVLSTILSAADVESDLIEWQVEDDSAEEGCSDDLAEVESQDFAPKNSVVPNKIVNNNRRDGHSEYDPDILIPPPRFI